jgi:hypothetical protein
MDQVLTYWISRIGEFPEGLRKREETGCCNPYGTYDTELHPELDGDDLSSTGGEPEDETPA